MNKTIKEAILTHAEKEFPRECCGVIILVKGRQKYIPCRNTSITNDNFSIAPEDWAAAEDKGDITAVVHSHCNIPPEPSQADLVGCEKSGLPWIIVSWPLVQFNEILPTGYEAPLIGREFCHGVLDCYALVRDYYKQEVHIDLPDFMREDEWWLKNQNLYLDNFEKADFVRVDNLQPNDGILMQVMSDVPNHAAVYLGNNLLLHHVMQRLSCREVYGGYWHKHTYCIVRHRSLL